MRLQEVRIHGNPPPNDASNLAQPSRLLYGLRKDLAKLWIKERASILLLMALTVFVIEALPPVVRDADR
jgi:hypothetical protein